MLPATPVLKRTDKDEEQAFVGATEPKLLKLFTEARRLAKIAADSAPKGRDLRLKAAELENPENPEANPEEAKGLRVEGRKMSLASWAEFWKYLEAVEGIKPYLIGFGEKGKAIRDELDRISYSWYPGASPAVDDEDGRIKGMRQFEKLSIAVIDMLRAEPSREATDRAESRQTAPTKGGPRPIAPRPVPPEIKQRPKRGIKKNLTVSERRAHTVAGLIEELDRLRPRMTGQESDYAALKKEFTHFKTFAIANRHPELRERVLNLQDHRRHYRLAQQLAAAHHGCSLATVQTDWKREKPDKYRRPKS